MIPDREQRDEHEQVVDGEAKLCVECAHALWPEFGPTDEALCQRVRYRDGRFVPTLHARSLNGRCGPDAALFQSRAEQIAERRRERKASPGFFGRLFGAA